MRAAKSNDENGFEFHFQFRFWACFGFRISCLGFLNVLRNSDFSFPTSQSGQSSCGSQAFLAMKQRQSKHWVSRRYSHGWQWLMRSWCNGSSTVLKPEAANLAIAAANDTAAPMRLDGAGTGRKSEEGDKGSGAISVVCGALSLPFMPILPIFGGWHLYLSKSLLVQLEEMGLPKSLREAEPFRPMLAEMEAYLSRQPTPQLAHLNDPFAERIVALAKHLGSAVRSELALPANEPHLAPGEC